MFPISDSIKARRFPFINITFIAITVFVFLEQLSAPNPDAFIEKYSLIPALIDFPNPLTLYPFVTAIFLHGGFLHIISNMWFLWIFGDNVEGKLGILLFPLLYFASGIAGNVLQYFLIPDSSIPMLGASGAIAGVLGAYYVFFPYSKIKTVIPIFIFLTIVDISAPFVLGFWFILQLIAASVTPIFSNQGGIAFWAHIGGFIFGVFFAGIYNLLFKARRHYGGVW